jgi:1-acyl-sn-glycerol-3-phosphate acyltransferase
VADTEEKTTETTTRLLTVVAALSAELHSRPPSAPPVTLDASLDRDLAFDSLGRMELLARLEQAFSVTVPERILADAETPRDLLRAILGADATKAAGPRLDVDDMALGAPGDVPYAAATLVDVLEWHARVQPDRLHVRFFEDDGEGEIITFGALHEEARAVALGLQARHLQPGESVAIMLPTSRDYFVSFCGILLAGGVPVPIYPPPRLTQIEEHLRRHVAILSNCRAGVLITTGEAKPLTRILRSQIETLRAVASVAELSETPGPFRAPAVSPGDVAFLQYTSGSTGIPKGVVLTHANLLANIRAMGGALDVGPDDVIVSWLPLYHDMGLIGAWLGSLHYAIPLVVMPPLSFLARPARWLRAIHRYRGTISAGPNFAYEACLRRISEGDLEGLDLSSWRVASNGAEPVSPDTVQRFVERFEPLGFRRETMMPMYGLAECCVGLTFPSVDRGPVVDSIRRDPFLNEGRAEPADDDDTAALRFVACGRPLPRHHLRIVDAAGRELPERRQGRLQFRGPSATTGYHRNPQATAALFDVEWLEPGDLAYLSDGDVFITGRSKDMIIRAGRNIHPAELEEAVGDLESVRKGCVAVFAGTDRDLGTERLIVLAETRRRDPATQERLRQSINTLAADLVGTPPDEVVLAPPNTVLKTSSGKIRRDATRQIYERGLVGKPRAAVWWQLTRLALAGLGPATRRMAAGVRAILYAAHARAVLHGLGAIVWLLVAALPRMSWRWAVMRAGLKALTMMTGTPVSVQGRENLPPGRACIIVSNHTSFLDGPVIIAALPGHFSFVAKAELLGSFLAGTFLKRIGTTFVDRFDAKASTDGAGKLATLAEAGTSLVFFSEGTFTGVPGLLPFRMGAFLAAAEAGVPVVPVAIRGNRSILTGDSGFARRGAISVVIGDPIEPDGNAETWAGAVALRDGARSFILNHCGEPDMGHERALLFDNRASST